MWNNIATKRNPKAPDYKCKQRACDGAIWPPKNQPVQNGNHAAPQAQPVNIGRMGVPILDEGEAAPATTHGDRLARLAQAHQACFHAALGLAVEAQKAGVPVSLDGVSALTAQLFIAFNEGH